jgi:hypothetical protein
MTEGRPPLFIVTSLIDWEYPPEGIDPHLSSYLEAKAGRIKLLEGREEARGQKVAELEKAVITLARQVLELQLRLSLNSNPNPHQFWNPYQEGVDTRKENIDAQCPYRPGSEEAKAWSDGFWKI